VLAELTTGAGAVTGHILTLDAHTASNFVPACGGRCWRGTICDTSGL
jgi:hypothetical protein